MAIHSQIAWPFLFQNKPGHILWQIPGFSEDLLAVCLRFVCPPIEKNDPVIPRLNPNLELSLLRIAQEALFNIAKHATTKEGTRTLRQEQDTIYLATEDKGAGIKAFESAKRSGSHGMTIMRERAEAFGGNFNVTSVSKQGTKIEVWVPSAVDH